MFYKFFSVCFLIVGSGLTACATASPDDPLAGYNHAMFDANASVDTALIEPFVKGYRDVTPKPIRDGVHNVLDNLRAPTDLMNNVLQGKPGGAAQTLLRFVVNSTIGIAGLFDPATGMGIPLRTEDFGQTLAVWGAGNGTYVVLPFLGPSNVRDTAGLVVDVFSHPFAVVRYRGETIVQLTRFTVNGVDVRTNAIGLIDNLEENSLDLYAAYRSLYEQSRADAIRDGELDVDDLPDFDEFDDE
ncbi:MAG: VacJ family lipoprotein [Robiginitomaculum sp.]|nr:MAG: VacJ family lipoprotein [Robiginitomaculum sp.]